ncbi:MAG: DUF2851 family protein [Oligosphaeraceae bacterium]
MPPCPYSERFLQILWNERMLRTHPLCRDGTPLRVLSGGLWNRGSGPDFTGAALLLGERLVRGDVELHRRASDWFAHGHDGDPAYQGVVLHVVWEDDLRGSTRSPGLPTLELAGQLLPSWEGFLRQVEAASYPHAREIPPGGCALQWALAEDGALQEILAAAGLARFQRHGRTLLQRGLEAGQEQSLYERVMEAMGYADNRENFLALARGIPLELLRSHTREGKDREALLALLLGAGGLLPDPTRQNVLPALRPWLRQAWNRWWQSGFSRLPLAWKPGGRPLNNAFRRTLAAAFWLHRCQCRPWAWLSRVAREHRNAPRALLKAVIAPLPEEPPWNQCRDFQHLLPRPAALLGEDRRRDLAQNVLLPLLGAHGEEAGDAALLETVRRAWAMLPRLQENHLLRKAVSRFLTPPSRWHELLPGAPQQQGMMDIFQNFCLALDHCCGECPLQVLPEGEAGQGLRAGSGFPRPGG